MSRSHRPRHRVSRHKPVHQIIIAKGDEVRSFTLHSWMIWGGALASLALTFWLFAATAYVVFRDDVLAAMVARQTRTQHAYEDRIAALRLQVDRVTSRQLLDQDAFNARLDELLKRQNALEQRTQQVSTLMDKARSFGLKNDDGIITGSLNKKSGIERTPRIDVMLARVEADLTRLDRNHELTLANLETKMKDKEKRIRGAVADLGLSFDRLVGSKPQQNTAQGGPLLPLRTNSTPTGFEMRASYVIDQMSWLETVRKSLNILPVRRPVSDEHETSSGFGARMDPFLGVPAFHAGLDFRGNTGDPVYAAATGTVQRAGRVGGYGNLVELSHDNGFSTRYGHLSRIEVKVGQRVAAGQLIGRIGSTGRSTGPHLHYETRIGKDAVNPLRFARAGEKLGTW